MTGPASVALAAVAVLAAGCGPPEAAGGLPETAPVDSALVRVLADVGLAEARAVLDPDPRRAADSLRAVALRVHGLRADDLRRQQARLARDPAAARATYDAVDRALTAERNGSPLPTP